MKRFILDLNKEISEFNDVYQPSFCRDIVFKNNSLVTRKTVLISPAHYFYYTKLVFDIVLSSGEIREVQYKSELIKAFYSGVLYSSTNYIENPKQIMFDNSYNQFQELLYSNEGKQAIKIDLSNFFDSILTKDLIHILYKKYDNDKVRKLHEFFDTMNILNLPQFHYSIASSILSQEYLSNFDNQLEVVLQEKNLSMVRFVDDMFFFFESNLPVDEHVFHTILDELNKLLWECKLNLNSNKVVLYIVDLFSREIADDSYGNNDDYSFKTVKRIEEKSISLINNDFMEFIYDVNTLFSNKGYNVKDFSVIFEETFSVDKENDSRKVLNNFVFSNKWRKLDEKDLQYIIRNFQFVFYLPDIFLVFYLKVYDFIERKNGRDEITIRKLLNQMDRKNLDSLRYLYSSLQYLIQRNFKREPFIRRIYDTDTSLGDFIKKHIV